MLAIPQRTEVAMTLKFLWPLFMAAALIIGATTAQAQVPKEIHDALLKIGQIVDPACTAKLYRPLMPKPDFNTYWPAGAAAPVSTAPLYPGIAIARDQSFGPDAKDVVDVFTGNNGNNLPIFMYVPGGGGNKIEQQVREGNAFYDNIGRWAVKNGMVGVLVQRHPGTGNWDDGGRDLSLAVDWVKANAGKFRGDGNRIFIAAHSAGTGPLGVYVGHPERWTNGVQVKGAIYMSGNPVPTAGGAGRAGGAGGAGGPGSTCGTSANMASNDGAIEGPSGQRAAGGGPGGPGRGRGGQQLTPEQIAERDNLPGFKATPVKIMLVRASWILA
jgi:hypothetical protein